MRIMWFYFCLYDKPQAFNLAAVLHTSGHNIDPGGIDTAVAQDVGKLGNILFNAAEGSWIWRLTSSAS